MAEVIGEKTIGAGIKIELEKYKEPGNIKYALMFLRSKYQTMPIEDFGPLKLKALRSLMIKEKDWTRGVINQTLP